MILRVGARAGLGLPALALGPLAWAKSPRYSGFWLIGGGWHSLVPVVAAGGLWIAGGSLRQSMFAGAVAGLFVSVPRSIAPAAPVFCVVPSRLGLPCEN
jgi:hypothetical protein